MVALVAEHNSVLACAATSKSVEAPIQVDHRGSPAKALFWAASPAIRDGRPRWPPPRRGRAGTSQGWLGVVVQADALTHFVAGRRSPLCAARWVSVARNLLPSGLCGTVSEPFFGVCSLSPFPDMLSSRRPAFPAVFPPRGRKGRRGRGTRGPEERQLPPGVGIKAGRPVLGVCGLGRGVIPAGWK